MEASSLYFEQEDEITATETNKIFNFAMKIYVFYLVY